MSEVASSPSGVMALGLAASSSSAIFFSYS